MDYGTVGVQEQRSLTFRIINKNPVEVTIKICFFMSPYFVLHEING